MQALTRYKKLIGGAGLLLMIAMVPAGCNKFLDREPLSRYTIDNYPYPSGGGVYDQFIYAAYSGLREYKVSAYAYVGVVSIRSDDADKGSTLFDGDGYGQIAMDNFTINPSTPLINDFWIGYYELISKCNVVLAEVAKDNTGTDESVKLSAQAEARFIRAYAYFMMVRVFANVPLVDSVVNISGSNIPQSSAPAVYAFIEQDLQFAATNLPATWDAKFIGRATSGAAKGLLAKVYLYEKKWSEAMTTAGEVISSGVYNLNTKYDDIFTERGENSSESLFEIQAYSDATNTQNYGCEYTHVQGVRGPAGGPQDLGWGFNDPSVQLEASYEANDPRRATTILYCPSLVPTRYGEVFPAEPNPRYNMKVYCDPAVRLAVNDRGGWWMNVRILRYADVLLMYAEAANELGQSSAALEKLEWVRARARNGNTAILPAITTTDKAQLRLAIQHERRIELAMEQERFFDLVRWGIAATTLHAAGKPNYKEGRDELLPIPQTQIDLSKGVLKQNPGW